MHTNTVEGLDYVPGELDRTAPPRIWLQIDTDGNNDNRSEPWPGADGVTWQDEEIGGLEIQYVRADLAALSSRQGEAVAWLVSEGDWTMAFTNEDAAIALAAGAEKAGCRPLTVEPLFTTPPTDAAVPTSGGEE